MLTLLCEYLYDVLILNSLHLFIILVNAFLESSTVDFSNTNSAIFIKVLSWKR